MAQQQQKSSTPTGKLSLYKQATPLERGSLTQGKLEVSIASPNERGLPSTSSLHILPPQPTPITSSASATEMWSRPEVHVVRHSSPHVTTASGPGTTASGPGTTAGNESSGGRIERRFSSDFVRFGALPSLREGEGGGEEGEEGVGGGEEKVEDTSSSHHPIPIKTSIHPSIPPVPGASGATTTKSSEETQKKRPRKPKGRVIPSRYLSSIKTTPSLAHKTLSTSTVTSSTVNKTQQQQLLSKKTSRSAQKPGKKDSSKSVHPPPPSRGGSSRPPSLSSTLPQQPFPPSGLTSSTPKVGCSQPLLSGNPPTTTSTPLQSTLLTTISRPPTGPRHKTKAGVSGSGSAVADSEVELLHCRLLQATYLDVKSAKALRVQEETAKTQLHTLWGEVEDRRRECQRLRLELETTRRRTALSSILDVQAKELAPVISSLPRLQQHHSSLAVSLDATRHELPTSGLLPATEQQLELELSRSEELLSDIVSLTKDKLPSVVCFADSTAAAVSTLDREFQELEKCWKNLSAAVRLQVKETSLEFERKQRHRTLPFFEASPSLQ